MPQGPFYLAARSGDSSMKFVQVGRYGLRIETAATGHDRQRHRTVIPTDDGPYLRDRLCLMFPFEDQAEAEAEQRMGAACPNAEDGG